MVKYSDISKMIRELLKEIAKSILKVEIDQYEKDLAERLEHVEELKIKLKECEYPNPKEELYNNKYPKINKQYKKNLLGEDKKIDVRCFVGDFNNYKLPTFEGTDDEISLKALTWIIENKKYKSDKETTGLIEYWNHSFESLLTNYLDCEDGAILLYDILRHNGVPKWKIRIVAGWAINPWSGSVDGHAYVSYYSEEYDKWVALDWCYFPNLESMENQPHYKDVSHYGDIWFSFNEKFCFSKAKD